MELGFVVGWMGVAFGLCVPIPQLIKIFKTRQVEAIALGTYAFLICCLICYLIHAIYIKSPVFTAAQSINLVTNGSILAYLIKRKYYGV